MTTRKRPSLRENMADGDPIARQLEQAAELEQVRRGDAPPAPPAGNAADAPAETTPFEASPSPVAALAHAYVHGASGEPSARSSGRALGTTAAILGVVAVALATGAGVLALQERGTPPEELAARISALEGKLNTAVSATLPERVAALEKAVAGLESRVAQASARPSTPGTSGSSQAVVILAARQLRAALARSAPFHSELELARLAGAAEGEVAKALDAVAPRAAEGIPTSGEIAAGFAALVPAVLGSELGTGSGGIGETMWGWVTGVATALRPPAPETVTEENRSATLLTRAGIMLEAGDLSGAVERVALLEGAAAEAAGPWLADARARIAADQAAMLLASRMNNLLATGKR